MSIPLNTPLDLYLIGGDNYKIGFVSHNGYRAAPLSKGGNQAKFVFIPTPPSPNFPGQSFMIKVITSEIPGAGIYNGGTLDNAYLGVGGYTPGVGGDYNFLFLTGAANPQIFGSVLLPDGTLDLVIPDVNGTDFQYLVRDSNDDPIMTSNYDSGYRIVPGIVYGGAPAPAPTPLPALPDTNKWYDVVNLQGTGYKLGTDPWRGKGAIQIKTVQPGNISCILQKFMFQQVEVNYNNLPSYVIVVTTDGLDLGMIPPAFDRETDRDTYVHVSMSGIDDNDSDDQVVANWRPDMGGDKWYNTYLFLVNDDRLATVFHFEQTATGFALYTMFPNSSTKYYLNTSTGDGAREVQVTAMTAPSFNAMWKVQTPDWMRRSRAWNLKDDIETYIPNKTVCKQQTGTNSEGEIYYYCNGFGQGFNMADIKINTPEPFNWDQAKADIIKPTSKLLQYVPGKTTHGLDLVCLTGRKITSAPSISHTTYLGTNDLVKNTASEFNLGGSLPTQYGLLSGSLELKTGHDISQHSDITTAEYNYKDGSGMLSFHQTCFSDDRILDEINPKFIQEFEDLPVITWQIDDWISEYVAPQNCKSPDSPCKYGIIPYRKFFDNFGTHMLISATVGRRFILNESILGTSSTDLRTLEAKACMELAPIGKEKTTPPAVQEEKTTQQEESAEERASDREPIGPPPSGIKPTSKKMMRFAYKSFGAGPSGPAAEACAGYSESTREDAKTKTTSQSRQVWGGDDTLAKNLLLSGGLPAEKSGLTEINESAVADWMNSSSDNDNYTEFEFMPHWTLLGILSQHIQTRMYRKGAKLEALKAYNVNAELKITALKMAFATSMQTCLPTGAPNVVGDIMYSGANQSGRIMQGMRVKAVNLAGVPQYGCWHEGYGCKNNDDCKTAVAPCKCRGDGCTKFDTSLGYQVEAKSDDGYAGTSNTCHWSMGNARCECDKPEAAAYAWTEPLW